MKQFEVRSLDFLRMSSVMLQTSSQTLEGKFWSQNRSKRNRAATVFVSSFSYVNCCRGSPKAVTYVPCSSASLVSGSSMFGTQGATPNGLFLHTCTSDRKGTLDPWAPGSIYEKAHIPLEIWGDEEDVYLWEFLLGTAGEIAKNILIKCLVGAKGFVPKDHALGWYFPNRVKEHSCLPSHHPFPFLLP